MPLIGAGSGGFDENRVLSIMSAVLEAERDDLAVRIFASGARVAPDDELDTRSMPVPPAIMSPY